MKIKEITLFTNSLREQLSFYTKVLEMRSTSSSPTEFTVSTEHTALTFKESNEGYKYHFCFLIPSNKLQESISWLKQRIDIVRVEGEDTQVHYDWKAESVYFFDAAGNIAEFIVRYDLNNNIEVPFDSSQILSMNEIGLPNKNVAETNTQLETKLGSKFWKGDLQRFGTNGSQEGLFLLVNNDLKKTWFPTSVKTKMAPFEAKIEVNGELKEISYNQGVVQIHQSVPL